MGILPANPAWLRAFPLDGLPFTDADVIRLLDELESKGVVHLFEHNSTVLMAIDPFPGNRDGNERYGPRRRPSIGATHAPEIAASRLISNPDAIPAAPSDIDAPSDPSVADPIQDDDFPEDFLEPPQNDPV